VTRVCNQVQPRQENFEICLKRENDFFFQADNWNTVTVLMDILPSHSYKLQYSVFKTRKAPVERKFLFVPNLLWGTEVNLFSEIFSLTVRHSGDGASYEPEEDKSRVVTFRDKVKKPHNQVSDN